VVVESASPLNGIARLARVLAVICAALAAPMLLAPGAAVAEGTAEAGATPEGIHKIQHVVMVMQENHSFDNYFGTYPGARGIPRGVCVPDPLNGGCVRPYHDASDTVSGGPHGTEAAIRDIDGGRMDGFVEQQEAAQKCTSTNPACTVCPAELEVSECSDVMGYHDAREIPNYWEYAKAFTLQDNLFEGAASWSLPEHLFMVSAWSARCPKEDENPMDCVGSLNPVQPGKTWSGPLVPGKATYAWTDLTYLMAKAHVSWRYYISEGIEPDCENDESITCKPVKQSPKTPGIWNPLADFTDVKQDSQLGNIQSLNHIYEAVHEPSSCGLPNVSWVVPNVKTSEHPPANISTGQAYVTTLINAIMRSPCWGSTAILLSWDDWGGYYDNVVPPSIDQNGYGLRVPGIVISPYAKTGYVDHQQLSHDAYLKFIEDDFLSGERLNPATDGRPDRRPDVREEAPGLGDIANDFDFNQLPRPPLLLSPHPSPGPASQPPDGGSQPPTLTERAASSITHSSATLNASVNPNGSNVSECRFEYGTSSAYEASVPCLPEPGAGESPVAVSAPLEGLAASTTYHFRVVATSANGESQGADQTFTTLAPVPIVTSVSPVAGLEAGGSVVRIEGGFLGGASAVRFGTAAATSFKIESDGAIVATAPGAKAGTVDVTVTSSGGVSATSSADSFTYVPKGPAPKITAITPTEGPAAGGTTVTVSGSGFAGVTSVSFGAGAAVAYSTQSATSLSAVSPPASAGKVDIRVSTPNGTSSSVLADRFTYGPPTVTAVSPNAGPKAGGTAVTVEGTGFAPGAGATTFKFGSATATSVQCSAITTCTLLTPARKAGAVDVRATVAGQTSLAAPPGDVFTSE
jgi:phospholipase C